MQMIIVPSYHLTSKKTHWGFDDPAGKEWSEFQRVRDEIGSRIQEYKGARNYVPAPS